MKFKRRAPLLPHSVSQAAQPPAAGLPHQNLPEPFDQLFQANFLRDPRLYERIQAFANNGNEAFTVDLLASLILDDLSAPDCDVGINGYGSLRYYARMHAIRALCGIKLSVVAQPARFAALLRSEYDELKDELPALFASFGPNSIEPLRSLAEDRSLESEARQRAASCMAKVAKEHPEARDEVAELVARLLVESGDDVELAGSLVADLVDLEAQERLPIIEQAYREGRVDSGIIRLSDVYEEFGTVRRKR